MKPLCCAFPSLSPEELRALHKQKLLAEACNRGGRPAFDAAIAPPLFRLFEWPASKDAVRSRIEDLESTGVGAIASSGAAARAVALGVGIHAVVAGAGIVVAFRVAAAGASRVDAPVAPGVSMRSVAAEAGEAPASRVAAMDAS